MSAMLTAIVVMYFGMRGVRFLSGLVVGFLVSNAIRYGLYRGWIPKRWFRWVPVARLSSWSVKAVAVLLICIVTIDHFMVLRVEWLSHRIQMITTFDCFYQERVCYLVAATAFLSSSIGSMLGINDLILRAMLAAVTFVVCVSLLLNFFTSSETENRIRRYAVLGYRNHRQFQIAGVLARLAFGFFMVMMVMATKPNVMWIYLISIEAAFYLSVCTPIPPSPKRKLAFQE